MPSAQQITSVVAGLSALPGVLAGFDSTSNSNVAVYWGQNSYGQSTGPLAQQRLSHYCENPDIDIIPLAFLTALPDPSTATPGHLDFANQNAACTLFPGTSLLSCPELAADIPLCQTTHNTTILLSLGGATASPPTFPSASAATAAADALWAAFGPTSANTSAAVLRPFGAAAVDGFDLDYEAPGAQNLDAFAARLRELMDAAQRVDGRRRLLTAAPQCPFPDQAVGSVLEAEGGRGVGVDAVFVQFYNNACGVQALGAEGESPQGEQSAGAFNFGTWDKWAKSSGAKVLVGVPASGRAAGSGYVGAGGLGRVVEYVRRFGSFGGVMMWDASQAEANKGFLGGVKRVLVERVEERVGEKENCEEEEGKVAREWVG